MSERKTPFLVNFDVAQMDYLESKGNKSEFIRNLLYDKMKAEQKEVPNALGAIMDEAETQRQALDFWKEKTQTVNGQIISDKARQVINQMAFDYKVRASWWLLPTLEMKIEFMKRMKELGVE